MTRQSPELARPSTRGLDRTDRFGNPIDPSVGYARGRLLSGHADEVRRMLHGRRTIAARVNDLGSGSVHNLTGVTRALPLTAEDVEAMTTQLEFYANFDGRAEAIGLAYAGGTPEHDAACFLTRVSAAFLAVMATLIDRGDPVLSVVPDGRSHPSIQNAVHMVGGEFRESQGLDAGIDALRQRSPQLVVITTITPQKYAFSETELRELIEAAAAVGAKVVLDDAHAAVRMAFFEQARPLDLGPVDLAVCSMDKHLWGPRAALVVGRTALLDDVRTSAFRMGIEAPFATYVASMRALESYDPQRVREAGVFAHGLRRQIAALFPDALLYVAGPGVAIHEDDLLQLVMMQAGESRSRLVPMEVSSLVAMEMLARSGLVTILAVGMPGSAAALRIMPYPDGRRVGVDTIVSTLAASIESAGAMLRDLSRAGSIIIGAAS